MGQPELWFYYQKEAGYEERLSNIFSLLREIERDLGVRTNIVESHDLKEADMLSLADRIRSIAPQERGSIVTSGGFMLPLSKTKRLNLGNTPVLLFYDGNGKPLYVFPCKMGERGYSVEEGLGYIRSSSPEFKTLPMHTEDIITSTISGKPWLLEDGLTFVARDYETGTGKADVLLRDSNQVFLVIEAEREAEDSAIGQILRIGAGLEKRNPRVRLGIVCFRIHEYVLLAAWRAGIEVWVVESQEPFTLNKKKSL